MTILAYDELLVRKDEIFATGTYLDSGFRAVSYELRLADDDCLVNGAYCPPGSSATADTGLIEIPPGQLAFLSTKEVFNLAPDLLGRFGLNFKYVRLGLVPLLSTFIRPGSRGRLYFPVFNASSDHIHFRPGEEILTVVFHKVRTSPSMPDIVPPAWDVLPTDVIEEHLKIRMVSTVQLERRIKAIREDVENMRSGQERVIALSVSVIVATMLGAILQTMFGLFAITQGMIPSGQTALENVIWILIPSAIYCGSVVFVVLLILLILTARRRREQ